LQKPDQKYWYVVAAVKGHHTITAAFAFSSAGTAYFSRSARPSDDVTGSRPDGQEIDNLLAFSFVDAGILGIGEAHCRFDNRIYDRAAEICEAEMAAG
jgi:hypothetical protein